MGIALLVEAGWLFHAPFLTGSWGGYSWTSPSTALALLLLGGGVFLHVRWSAHRLSRRFALVLAGIPALLGLLSLVRFFTGLNAGVQWTLYRTSEAAGAIPVGRVSPLAAALFFLEGAALILLVRATRWRFAANGAALLALLGDWLSLVVLLGYAYGAPLMYGGGVIPVALPTVLAFALLGAAESAIALPQTPALRAWSGDSARGVLLRAFLPAMLFFILVEDWVVARTLAFLHPMLVHSLSALACAAVVVGVSIWAARRAGDALDRAGETLRASEERFRSMFQHSAAGMALVSPDYRFLRANGAFCRMLGYTESELLGRTFQDVTLPADRPTSVDLTKLLLSGETEAFHLEKRYLRKDGTAVWGLASVTSFRNARNQPMQIVVQVLDIDERRIAEDRLRESEERFHSLFENAPLGYQSLDQDGRFIEVNQAWLDTLGYSREEVVGKWFGDFLAPEFVPVFIERFPKYMATGRTHSEYRMLHKSGERRFIAFEGRVGRSPGGAFQQTHCILQDITERERAQEALRASEANFRDLFETAPVAYHELDRDGLIRRVNHAECALLGYEAEEMLGRPAWDFVAEADRQASREAVRGKISGKQPLTISQRHFVRRDGSELCLEIHDILVGNATAATSIRSALLDITGRKRAEAYREIEREILQVLNEPREMRDAIERVLAALNKATECDAVGIRLQEGEDFPYFAQAGFPKDFVLAENTLTERSANGGACRDELGRVRLVCTCGLVLSGRTDPANPIFTKGGSCWLNNSFPLLDLPAAQDPRLHPRNLCIHYGYASIALIPIRAQGGIVGLIQLNDRRKGRFSLDSIELLEGIACRIGEALMRRRAEEEKVKLEAQFRQLQKMESVGRLAGGVAHDFNNLLTVINGHSHLLLAALGAGDPLRDSVAEIHKAGERAAALTRQLLAFSRKQILDPRKLDIDRVVEELRPMLVRLVGEDIEVRTELHARGETIHVDPHQLEQVVMNLVVNARDAMPGAGRLLIETAGVERDESFTHSHPAARVGRYVMLAVSDTGVGMDEETRNRIFEPFFTTKEVGKGTGLGLSTVQGIVAQSGGYVEVYSEKNNGTTFKIYLPSLAEEAADAARPPAPPAIGGKETVLVVEDQADVRNYAVAALKGYGYRVIPVESAAEALKRCAREPIDLVLTDVVMPRIGGKELANRLETLWPGVKVLFMSGYTDNVIERHGVLEEGAAFIQKPFSPEQLARKVRAVLGPPPN